MLTSTLGVTMDVDSDFWVLVLGGVETKGTFSKGIESGK